MVDKIPQRFFLEAYSTVSLVHLMNPGKGFSLLPEVRDLLKKICPSSYSKVESRGKGRRVGGKEGK